MSADRKPVEYAYWCGVLEYTLESLVDPPPWLGEEAARDAARKALDDFRAACGEPARVES